MITYVCKSLELLPHCGDPEITLAFCPRSRYLCINSAPHYLCPPLRGLQNSVSLFLKSRYPCVNGTPYHLRPPLRGLKHFQNNTNCKINNFRIISSLRGHQNHDILYPESKHLYVNSTSCYLRLMHKQCTVYVRLLLFFRYDLNNLKTKRALALPL